MGGRCYRRLPPTAVAGLGLDARRQRKKAFAQSERACVRGLCKVSPSPVLVRRQPFIGPGGQGCQMGCQLHVNFEVKEVEVGGCTAHHLLLRTVCCTRILQASQPWKHRRHPQKAAGMSNMAGASGTTTRILASFLLLASPGARVDPTTSSLSSRLAPFVACSFLLKRLRLATLPTSQSTPSTASSMPCSSCL